MPIPSSAQLLFGEKTYNARGSVYGAGMVRCGHCQRPLVVEIKQRLLDLRLLDEIEADTFAAKQNELRAKETRLLTKLEGFDRQQSERGELAVKVFELSQALGSKWLAADIAEKRLLLEIIGLNWTLDGVNLVPQMRKPFDLLAEGLLVQSSRGDRI